MICSDCEGDRIDTLMSFRDLRLCQHILAIVKALEDEGCLSGLSIQVNILEGTVRKSLHELEFSAFEGCAVRIDLVHLYLVGEGDDHILLGLVGLLAGRAILSYRRVVAVLKVALVDIAFLAKNRILIEGRVEENLNFGVVQGIIGNLRTFLAFPGKGQVEGVFVGSQIIIIYRSSVHGHRSHIAHGQAVFHRIMEGNVILHIIRNVVRQLSGQLIRDLIANIIVRGILPARCLAGSIIGIHDLLLEARLLSFRILHIAGQSSQLILCRQRQVAGVDIAAQVEEDIAA